MPSSVEMHKFIVVKDTEQESLALSLFASAVRLPGQRRKESKNVIELTFAYSQGWPFVVAQFMESGRAILVLRPSVKQN